MLQHVLTHPVCAHAAPCAHPPYSLLPATPVVADTTDTTAATNATRCAFALREQPRCPSAEGGGANSSIGLYLMPPEPYVPAQPSPRATPLRPEDNGTIFDDARSHVVGGGINNMLMHVAQLADSSCKAGRRVT